MISRFGLLAASALAAVAFASSAGAQSADWAACDGYGAANRSGDGMTEYANFLLIFNPPGYGTTARGGTGRGAYAVAACTNVLDDLHGDHWRRRINLLQARALHQIELGQAEAALADLDLAQTTVEASPTDFLFDRSQRVSLMLVRAWALQRLDRADEARALVAQAAAQRPYDRGVVGMIDSLGLAEGSEIEQSVAEQRMRLDPRTRAARAVDLFEARRYAEFLPVADYAVNASGLREMEFTVLLDSMRAYALAATGRFDEADALLATLQNAPQPAAVAKSLQQREGRLVPSRPPSAQLARIVESTALAVERRRMIAEGRAAEVIADLPRRPVTRDSVGADLLLALADAAPSEHEADLRSLAEQALADTGRDSSVDQPANLEHVFEALPAAEIPQRRSAWREARRPFLSMEGSASDLDAIGYRERTLPDGRVTVRFRGITTPNGQVEEMALLRAALLAREAGYGGFIITERRDTEWSINTTQYGVTLRTDPNGYETEIDVRFVQPGAADAPAALVLESDRLIADLSPIYIPEDTGRRRR